MTKGMNKVDDKNRRKQRRRNHIARDLAKPEFRQKRREGKPRDNPPEIDEWDY